MRCIANYIICTDLDAPNPKANLDNSTNHHDDIAWPSTGAATDPTVLESNIKLVIEIICSYGAT